MGIKTSIELMEVNKLFPKYNFMNIAPTKNGIMDTTYILHDNTKAYILKKYERDIEEKLQTDKELLELLSNHNLNTPSLLDACDGWYLYTKLNGKMPKNIQLTQIQTLAGFMARLHNITQGFTQAAPFLASYDINMMLYFTKKHYFSYYKKLYPLKKFQQRSEGFIHGDLFIDNTLFEKNKIAVFDFIDGGLGEFCFDVAVALLSFNPKGKPLYTKIFLQTYNQRAKKKITYHTLQKQLQTAARFYTLLRIHHDKRTKRARELINLC